MAAFNFFQPQQQKQQQKEQQQQLRTCQARCPERPLPNSLTYHTQQLQQGTIPAFTPLPTRLPPPPTTTRRNYLARPKSQSSQQVQQEKTTQVINVRQPSLPLTQEYQDLVQVQPFEQIFALDQSVITTNTIQPDTSIIDPLLFTLNPDLLTSMESNFDINMESFDWDQFLVDDAQGELNFQLLQASVLTSISVNALIPKNTESPAPSDSQVATPKSTESEQSAALDPENDFDFNFDFELPSFGISHRPEDMLNPVQPVDFTSGPAADTRGTADPTMTSTFGLSFGDFGLHTDLGADAASQLGLTNLLDKLGQQQKTAEPATISPINDLSDANALLNKLFSTVASPPSIQPSQLSLSSSPMLKRKGSDASDESLPAAKRRGRPPGAVKTKSVSLPEPTRAYRQSTGFSNSPALSAGSVADESEMDSPAGSSPAVVKRTISGKPSTARPKSVVPEKFLKDGSAQAILGMDINQIQSYPSFDMLLKDVEASRVAAAKDFGERIADNRDKAKDAAKKSRDERRAKIERSDVLEKKVEDLEAKLKGMTSVLLTLVDRGILNKDQVASYL
ncbi:uncharacterized protein IL334_001361 [Kwoniella shivajii]|uniref:BZIP domain-containing protein n=1 Tax=Kwoniella shivajii TaxID=564305 RepID=A0ABZ1CTB7_9TREE|nr:hypothetical protein IL334_001361 [Kwoniella shivajii]